MRNNKIFFYLFLVVLGVWLFLSAHSQLAVAQVYATKTTILLDIDGAIGPGVQDYIHRGIELAAEKHAVAIILRIDTPGGLSKSMRDIIKDILTSPVPVISYVAPSGARAASAGTYILYASQIAAMAPGTNLGAATPVTISPEAESDKKAKTSSAKELKEINDAKAYIRSLAQLRGRNVQWAEEAVSKGESLSANEALKKNVIDVIASDLPDLLQKVNGKIVLVRGKTVTLQTLNSKIQQINPDWRAKFLAVITDPSVAYILLIIGFYGLFFEFASPGFVAPGVIGAICLLLALYAFQLLPINYAGLALIILGMALLIAEVFVSSFGVLGIGGIIAFIMGSIMLMKTGAIGFTLPIKLIVGVSVATILFCLGVVYFAYRSRRRPVVSGKEGMVGLEGIVTQSHEKTWVRLEGELWGIANPENLHEGDRVKVKIVKNLEVVVEKCKKQNHIA